jgi:hypothetical protein
MTSVSALFRATVYRGAMHVPRTPCEIAAEDQQVDLHGPPFAWGTGGTAEALPSQVDKETGRHERLVMFFRKEEVLPEIQVERDTIRKRLRLDGGVKTKVATARWHAEDIQAMSIFIRCTIHAVLEPGCGSRKLASLGTVLA